MKIGFNVQRRAFYGENYEIQPNKWNETYVDLIEKEVNDFGDLVFFTISDMHQDVLSKFIVILTVFLLFILILIMIQDITVMVQEHFPEPISKPVSFA